MWLSVIIPAYNEEKRIAKTLLEINYYMKKQSYDCEILVVNDGSKDRTAEVVEKLKATIPNLGIINNAKNNGKGYVVRQGLLAAKGKYRLFTDSDNSTPIAELEKFFPYVNKYDIIIGSRAAKGANIISPQPWQRRFLGNAYRLMVKIFTGFQDFDDTQCGFKLFNVRAVNDILPRCRINGWSFDVEILVLAKKLGYAVKEAPINWLDSPGTKVKIRGGIEAIFDLFRISYYK